MHQYLHSDLNSGKKVRVFHLGGGGGVSSDLNSGKKVRVFHLGRGVLGKLRSELRKASLSFSLGGVCSG